MNIEVLRARYRETVALMRALVDSYADREEDFSDEDQQRFDELEAKAKEDQAVIEILEKRQQAVEGYQTAIEGEPAGGFNINRNEDPYDMSSVRFDATDLRARVETALEKDKVTPDDVKTHIVRSVRGVHGSIRQASLRCLATGAESYRSAFAKMVAGQMHSWTDEERQAVSRAQSLTDAAGGFAVPFTLDPTIIGLDGLSINPFRRISRVVRTTTDSWNGVTGTAVSWSWDAEAAEVSDDAITLAQPSIPVYKAAGFIPFSFEIEGDWASIDSDLRTALMEGRDNLEATAHAKGTGSGQPTGIETALDGSASEIAPATAEVFAAADVYELQRLLPPRHRQAGPVWVMNIGTANDIRQFDTAGGGDFWTNLGPGTPSTLLGWRWEEASTVDDSPDINPAAAEQNFILFVGNWSRYVIVDRVGMNVELIPHLFATGNNRPSGQRGIYAWLRSGADSVDDNAFRVLSIPTV